MLKRGCTQLLIANTIGRDKSVVCREIKRNCDQRSGVYSEDLAQRKYVERQKEKPKKRHFTKEVEKYVKEGLAKWYSPEQIVGIADKEGISCVSHESIYHYIWNDKRRGGKLHKQLRRAGRRYRKRGAAKDRRGLIKGRVDISLRPVEVEARQRLGDLEIDTIIGKGHKGAIVTINDRVSGILRMAKLESKDAGTLAQATIQLLEQWKPYLHTITSDNGKEFADHHTISHELDVGFYFARPYHSWERGSNENLNGLIRQYIPKKTDFSTLDNTFIKYVENQLNNRPRKRHNFESPNTIFNQLINQTKVAFIN